MSNVQHLMLWEGTREILYKTVHIQNLAGSWPIVSISVALPEQGKSRAFAGK